MYRVDNKPQVTCLYSLVTLVSRLGCRHAS